MIWRFHCSFHHLGLRSWPGICWAIMSKSHARGDFDVDRHPLRFGPMTVKQWGTIQSAWIYTPIRGGPDLLILVRAVVAGIAQNIYCIRIPSNTAFNSWLPKGNLSKVCACSRKQGLSVINKKQKEKLLPTPEWSFVLLTKCYISWQTSTMTVCIGSDWIRLD